MCSSISPCLNRNILAQEMPTYYFYVLKSNCLCSLLLVWFCLGRSNEPAGKSNVDVNYFSHWSNMVYIFCSAAKHSRKWAFERDVGHTQNDRFTRPIHTHALVKTQRLVYYTSTCLCVKIKEKSLSHKTHFIKVGKTQLFSTYAFPPKSFG